MPLQHFLTFAILGAAFFLATVSFLNQNFSLAFAYVMAGCSWFVVAAYEYNERVFSKAVKELLKKHDIDVEQ